MRVLVGITDIDYGLEAFDAAAERAHEAGDELTVAVYAQSEEALEEAVQAVRDRTESEGLDVPIETIESDPASQLVELAERGEFDQIVLPGGQKSPLGKIRLDDIHEFILLNARATVRLVR